MRPVGIVSSGLPMHMLLYTALCLLELLDDGVFQGLRLSHYLLLLGIEYRSKEEIFRRLMMNKNKNYFDHIIMGIKIHLLTTWRSE